MCNVNCILFGTRNLLDEEIRGRRILEVGSCDVNGSLRPFVESRKPSEYIGIDIVAGRGVDLICSAEDLLDRFGEESFDVVISTELLEHVRDWRKVISNLKRVCKAGGIILITTRSIGFPFHSYPYDYWRYEPEDMEEIFSDCEIQVLERDPDKGVFLKAAKPLNFEEEELPDYQLYSVAVNRRVKQISDKDLRNWHLIKLHAKRKAKDALLKVAGRLYRLV
jgi:SAM-dependent methyltransferase